MGAWVDACVEQLYLWAGSLTTHIVLWLCFAWWTCIYRGGGDLHLQAYRCVVGHVCVPMAGGGCQIETSPFTPQHSTRVITIVFLMTTHNGSSM